MELPDPNDPPPNPPGPEIDYDLDDWPSDRARLVTTFAVIVLAMIGLAFVVAAVIRALS